MGDKQTDQDIFDSIKDSPVMANALNLHGKLILSQNEKRIADTATGAAYGNIDAVAKELLGLDKGEGKTSEIYRKHLEELVKLRKTKGTLDGDIQAALDKQKGIHDDAFTKAQNTIADLEASNLVLLSKGKTRDITSVLSEALQGKTFKAHYSTDDIKELSSSKFARIIANTKIEDGKQVFYDANGNKRTNSKGVDMTAAEVIEEDFGSMLEVKAAGGGADADGKNNDTVTLEGDKVDMEMGEIKTRAQFLTAFNKKMAAAGIAVDLTEDSKYIKHLKATRLEYAVEDLPVT